MLERENKKNQDIFIFRLQLQSKVYLAFGAIFSISCVFFFVYLFHTSQKSSGSVTLTTVVSEVTGSPSPNVPETAPTRLNTTTLHPETTTPSSSRIINSSPPQITSEIPMTSIIDKTFSVIILVLLINFLMKLSQYFIRISVMTNTRARSLKLSLEFDIDLDHSLKFLSLDHISFDKSGDSIISSLMKKLPMPRRSVAPKKGES